MSEIIDVNIPAPPKYHLGWDEANNTFVLWMRGVDSPILEIDAESAQGMSTTLRHVQMTHAPQPSALEPHRPRINLEDPRTFMTGLVSEIEDGIFVAWDICAGCLKHVTMCRCGTPKEPKYITEWRKNRFDRSIKDRFSPKQKVYDDEDRPPLRPPVREIPTPVETETVADQVDDGLNAALDAVQAAKEDQQ